MELSWENLPTHHLLCLGLKGLKVKVTKLSTLQLIETKNFKCQMNLFLKMNKKNGPKVRTFFRFCEMRFLQDMD